MSAVTANGTASTPDAGAQPEPTLQHLKESYQRLRLKAKIAEASAVTRALSESYPYSPFYGYGLDIIQHNLTTSQDGWIPLAGATNAGYLPRRDPRAGTPLQNETQQDAARRIARWLLDTNPLAQGALTNLRNFVVRKGFRWTVEPEAENAKDPIAQKLAAMVQVAVDGFQDRNNWRDREKQWFWRSRRDGEVIIRLFADPETGRVRVRVVEPEQVRIPAGNTPWPEWFPPNAPENPNAPEYSDGVYCDPDDQETVLAYHVQYRDNEPGEWVKPEEIYHFKLNVDETVKRGLSDFYSTHESLEEVRGLLRNLAVGAKLQAALAGIRKHGPGVSKAQAEGMVTDLRTKIFPNLTNPVTGKNMNLQQYPPGSILDVGNTEYMAPPWMSQGAPNHIQIVQAALRAVAQRWCMPEFLATGDASNANYASTLVSGAPFVAHIECVQDEYREFFSRIIWAAIAALASAAAFQIDGYTYTAAEIRRLVDLKGEPPVVAIANKMEEENIRQIRRQNGVLSPQTWAKEVGLDFDAEAVSLDEYNERFGGVGGLGGMGDDGGGDMGGLPPSAPPGSAMGQGLGESLDALDLGECDHGENKGKPGPCPEGDPNTAVEKPKASRVVKRSSSKNVDAYRVGNVIKHDDEWHVVTGYNRRVDDQGGYEHVLSLRQADDAERKRGRISELQSKQRAMGPGPDDERRRKEHDEELLRIDNEIRTLQGKASVEDERTARAEAAQKKFEDDWVTGNVYDRLAYIKQLADRPGLPLHGNVSFSTIRKTSGVDLSAILDADEGAPEVTAQQLAAIASLAGVTDKQLRDGDGVIPKLYQSSKESLRRSPPGLALTESLRLPDIRQSTDFSCGAAASAAVFFHFGVPPKTESEAMRLLGTSPADGTDPEHIVAVAQEHGLETVSTTMTLDDLAKHTAAGRPVITPIQAWMEPDEDPAQNESGHYVAVTGVDSESVYVQDPVSGPTTWPRDAFDEAWHDADGAGNLYERHGIVFFPPGTGQSGTDVEECDQGANKGKPGPCPKPGQKQTGTAPAKTSPESSSPLTDSSGPSKPGQRKQVQPPALKFVAPPPPQGKSGKKAGGFAATGQTNTAVGDHAEEVLQKLGLRSILPKGKRQNPLDMEFDHSGYAFEVKACTVNSTQYKAKPKAHEMEEKRAYAKKHGLKAGTMIAVVDHAKGEIHAYYRDGIGAFQLNPATAEANGWKYAGTVRYNTGAGRKAA